MIKYLRYELKRSRSFLLFLVFLSLLSSSLIAFFYKINNAIIASNRESTFILYIAQGLVLLTMALVFFAVRFKRDIFDKSSYITFTINISIGKVLMAKFFASLIGFLLISLSYYLSLILLAKIFSFWILFENVSLKLFISYGLVLSLYYGLAYLLLVFGIILARVKIFRRYYNFVTIVLAITIFSLIIWIFRNIYVILPTSLNLSNLSIERLVYVSGIDISMIYFGIDGKIIGINVWTFLFSVLIMAILFFVNEYLIEERIDF